jgi:SPP1 gp7 family putative phage head morphogenesis protein
MKEKIIYDGKVFRAKGKFGVRLAKEFQALGAVMKNGAYKLPNKIGDPILETIKTAAQAQQKKAQDRAKRMEDYLLTVDEFPDVDCEPEVKKLLDDVGVQVEKSIGVEKQLKEEERQQIVQAYVDNINTYSKKLLKKSNKQMREYILEEVTKTNLSSKDLAKVIEERFGVTGRHAKFIARQEAHMAREQINRATAESIGFRHYVWQTVGDYRVRPMGGSDSFRGDNHKRLDGKIFSFDDPPIVDRIKNRKCNPGEDYGCRCTARVIIDDDYYEL